jgi:glycosyltransferase involved in cell wall biosynthesis
VLGHGSSNGIDTDYFYAQSVPLDKPTLRKQCGIPNEALLFLFVGRVVTDKGIAELTEAFTRLAEKHPHIWLLVVGPTEPHLDPVSPAVWQQLNKHPRIVLTGYQNDVRPYMKMSDVLVLPSYREGFPNVPLQAGAMTLPSIVTDINGCNEIITHNKNGWVVPPKDAEALLQMMEALIENPDMVDNMSAISRQSVVSQFSQPLFWQNLSDFYRSDKVVPFYKTQKLTTVKGGLYNDAVPTANVG